MLYYLNIENTRMTETNKMVQFEAMCGAGDGGVRLLIFVCVCFVLFEKKKYIISSVIDCY